MADETTAPAPETAPAPAPMPTTGGTYTRQPDGSLVKDEPTPTEQE